MSANNFIKIYKNEYNQLVEDAWKYNDLTK